jgi:hypothetical protein
MSSGRRLILWSRDHSKRWFGDSAALASEKHPPERLNVLLYLRLQPIDISVTAELDPTDAASLTGSDVRQKREEMVALHVEVLPMNNPVAAKNR